MVPYEPLCADPSGMLARVYAHAGLGAQEALVRRFSERMSAPAYYAPRFSEVELRAIKEETAATAARFGYGG